MSSNIVLYEEFYLIKTVCDLFYLKMDFQQFYNKFVCDISVKDAEICE